MATNKKKDDEIVISKKKLFKTLALFTAFLLFLIICFSISEEYKESSSSEETSETDSDSGLQDIIQEAGEISDDEKTEPNEISIDRYLELYNGSENKIILLSRPTCQYCQIATPIIENIIYKYGVEINYLNTDELGDDGNTKLISSDEYFSEGYGTPLVLVVGNGKIVDKIEGLATKSEYISFFKRYNFME